MSTEAAPGRASLPGPVRVLGLIRYGTYGTCLLAAALMAKTITADSPTFSLVTAASHSMVVASPPKSMNVEGAHFMSLITPVRISLTPDGDRADGASSRAAVSADGRWVAFQSEAENLTPGAGLGLVNVLARPIQIEGSRDFSLGDTQLIGVVWDESDAELPDTTSTVLSSDGRFVAFRSSVGGSLGAPGSLGLFVHDIESGKTTAVDAAHDGGPPDGLSASPSISADGRLIAFHSHADNLVLDDNNGHPDVFVHDLDSGATRLVSQQSVAAERAGDASAGDDIASGNGASLKPWSSSDGRVIVFESDASDLVSADDNGVRDIFAFDLDRGELLRINLGPGGAEASRDSHSAAASADGRFVVFVSDAGELSPSALPGASAVYLHDRELGLTSLVSIPFDGRVWGLEPTDHADMPSISADGRLVAFRSRSRRLAPSALDPPPEIHVLDRTAAQWSSIRSAGPDGDVDAPLILTRGALGKDVIVFSTARPIDALDTNTVSDIYAARLPPLWPATRIILPWLSDDTTDIARGIDFNIHYLAPLESVRAHGALAGDH